MSDEEGTPSKAPPGGLPAWVMTFADLMSLLMCFFALLLSFSQMDLSKFKKVAGSMENAFGVQREIVAYEIPKGTSVVAQEFSPGKPTPTPLNEIRQVTIQELRQTLEFDEERTKGTSKNKPSDSKMKKKNSSDKAGSDGKDKKTAEQIARDAAEALAQEIMQGTVEVEALGQRVIVRIMEHGSFESGLATLKPDFYPIIKKLNNFLKDIPGDITIEGHTDNIPIYNSQFKSNWALSAQRAVEVAHAILDEGEVSKARMSVAGYAETKPLFDNNSAKNRRKNRRVEIVLVQGDRPDYKSIDEVNATDYQGNPLERKQRQLGTNQTEYKQAKDLKLDDLKLDYDSYRDTRENQFKTWDDFMDPETFYE